MKDYKAYPNATPRVSHPACGLVKIVQSSWLQEAIIIFRWFFTDFVGWASRKSKKNHEKMKIYRVNADFWRISKNRRLLCRFSFFRDFCRNFRENPSKNTKKWWLPHWARFLCTCKLLPKVWLHLQAPSKGVIAPASTLPRSNCTCKHPPKEWSTIIDDFYMFL